MVYPEINYIGVWLNSCSFYKCKIVPEQLEKVLPWIMAIENKDPSNIFQT